MAKMKSTLNINIAAFELQAVFTCDTIGFPQYFMFYASPTLQKRNWVKGI